MSSEPIREQLRERLTYDEAIGLVQEAIGQWGGPERQHYTAAMNLVCDNILNHQKGLDLWGRPLDAEALLGAMPQAMAEKREGMMRKSIIIAVLWFSCGYIGAAEWAGHFYGEFGPEQIETRGSASRSAVFYFIIGPVGAFCGLALSEHPPMWDWPRYLLEYREAQHGK